MKKKIVASLLASGIITSSLVASNEGFYVGLDFGKTEVKVKYSESLSVPSFSYYSSESGTGTDDGGSQTLKVGYYFDNNSRANLFFQNINSDFSSNPKLYGVGYDYLIGDHDFKPFIGAILGYGSAKDDDLKISGAVYGIQAGINYAFNENVSLEAGYRYMKSNMKYSESDTNTLYSYSYELKLDTLTNWYIGANYKF